MVISREFLLSFSSTTIKPNRATRRRIFFFNLTKKKLSHKNYIQNNTYKTKNNLDLTDSISISFLNIRSLNKKSSIIYDLLSSSNYDVLALSETWHESSSSPSLLSSIPPNYTFLEIARPPTNPISHKHSCYGGLCLIYKNNFSSSFNSTIKYETFECLFSTFKFPVSNLIIILIYRPPKGSISTFLDEFFSLIEYVFSLSSPFIILGDFNIHFNNTNDFYVLKFNSILKLFNLSQHVNFPTHTSENTIDLLITSSTTKIDNLAIKLLPPSVTDHSLIEFFYNSNKKISNNTVRTLKRNWKLFNKDNFYNIFSSFSFEDFSDVDSLVSYFQDCISSTLDKILPLKLYSFRPQSKCAPWFDAECATLKRSARKHERSFRLKRSHSSYLTYLSAANKYKHVLFTKHSNYLRKSITLASSSKHRWSELSKLLNKNLPPPSSFSAQEFHDYITHKVQLIRSDFNITSSNDSQSNNIINTSNLDNILANQFVSFSPITLSDLTSIINSMSTTTCALDIIPTNIIKDSPELFYPIILKIVNLSLSSSRFPSFYKSSIIIPTLKNNSLDPSLLTNYRPISNLIFISKIIEKVVYQQLYSYLHSHSLIPPFQSGFRVGFSCETSLLKLYNDLIINFDNKKGSVLLCLDYSSAFDTIDHSSLLQILIKNFNITGPALSWLKSYLCDRSAYAFLNNTKSIPSTTCYGVPQGSILGPLLFILYVSELSTIISSYGLNSLSYADDSHLYACIENSSLDVTMSSISSCLASIEDWSNSLSLKLNPSKFELIYFDRTGNLTNKNPCIFSNNHINPSNHIRSLGFIFDSKLNLSEQILSVTKTCYFHLRRIKQLTPLLDDPTLQLLVSALILSRIDYCNSLYYNLPESTIKPLTKVFNYSARLVSRSPRNSHISPSLILLHWLPLKYRFIFKISVIMYKLKNNISPDYLKSLIHLPNRSNLRSSSHNHNFIPSINHSFAKRSFSYAGPYIWNSLPPHLTDCCSLLTFRKNLKTFLFQKFITEYNL